MHSQTQRGWERRPSDVFRWARRLAAAVLTPLLLAWAARGLAWCPMPGVRLHGVELPTHAVLHTLLERKAMTWGDESLTLHVGYHVFQPTRTELGLSLNVADAERELCELGRSANPLIVWHALWVGLYGPGFELRWQPRIHDPQRLDAYIEQLRSQIDRLPTLGSYDPAGGLIEGLPGEALDTDATRRAIARAAARADDQLEVTTIVTPAPHTYRRFERPADAASVLMFSQLTAYQGGSLGRATNIELAAQKLNGVVLQPGAAFSFNAVVGKREAARGFAKALELQNGELAEGIGGGVCQVAGTLHAAAFFAGLSVEEYHAHSRLNRFAYLQPGLDAMVAWPDAVNELQNTRDMRLRNAYPFPVLIKTSIETLAGQSQRQLRVSLYGSAKPFRVDFAFEVLERVAAGELQRSDPSLRPGEQRVRQEPLDGIVIARHRTIYTPLRRIEELTRVAYPPTPRIVDTGPSPP